MKEFKANEKSQIIAMAKLLYTNYTVKREKVENQLSTIEDKFDFDGKLEAYRKKLEEQLNDRTKKLRDSIAEYKKQEDIMSGPLRTLYLDNHRVEEVVKVEYVSDGDGKRKLSATFLYPDTILPPEDNLGIEETAEDYAERNAGAVAPIDEGPEYDGAGFNGSAEELAADMEQERLADEARADAMHDCEDREADIDVDMQGEFKPIEEGPEVPVENIEEGVDALVESVKENPDYYVEEFAADTAEKFSEAVEKVVSQMPAPAEEEDYLTDPEEESDDDPWEDDAEDTTDESDDEDPFKIF